MKTSGARPRRGMLAPVQTQSCGADAHALRARINWSILKIPDDRQLRNRWRSWQLAAQNRSIPALALDDFKGFVASARMGKRDICTGTGMRDAPSGRVITWPAELLPLALVRPRLR